MEEAQKRREERADEKCVSSKRYVVWEMYNVWEMDQRILAEDLRAETIPKNEDRDGNGPP